MNGALQGEGAYGDSNLDTNKEFGSILVLIRPLSYRVHFLFCF